VTARNFDSLHPALQHHIVNSLGWRDLRPFQDEAIAPILAGHNVLILAPTAGGKTEAATLPILSRMLAEEWRGLSVLYLCPLKALLNNLHVRLANYCNLVGRRAAIWHGDIGDSARRTILGDPPDLLLTTPESLEVMLISRRVEEERLFANLRAVIIDEIHAFAGDDRGWHLLSVLERTGRLARLGSGREVQRVGLSATVGNPDKLIEWLAGSCDGPRSVLAPSAAAVPPASDVTIDYVGSIPNAALVISRLHRGEKRLVFVESRARSEQLCHALRQLGVTAFVTHSSLSQEARRQAEDAFANRDDCFIVATSVLELGIDVGDLDRVIQIDSPGTVASFLQRMGRTGRRSGTTRNCLFLATSEWALVRAAALVDLWRSGYVEPIMPPAAPYHLLAQQLMAIILQNHGAGRQTWREWVGRMPGFAAMPDAEVESIVGWMLESGILFEDDGILGIGRTGEEEFGRRHFMELMSVFTSPPLFQVLHGRDDLGQVDALSFMGREGRPRILLLGGRSWRVTHIDWDRHLAYVERAEGDGASRWRGGGPMLGFRFCQAMRDVLARDDTRSEWSERATQTMRDVRQEFAWLAASGTTLRDSQPPDGTTSVIEWWTFAGTKANTAFRSVLQHILGSPVDADATSLRFDASVAAGDAERAITSITAMPREQIVADIEPTAIDGLKFSQCVPAAMAATLVQSRMSDQSAIEAVMRMPVHTVTG
jgi:ATP-dependent helicase Lhr and Lhr-like helicase